MDSYVGKSPNTTVGIAIMATEINMAVLRLTVSPSQPKAAEPKGRMMKPAANTPYVAKSEATVFSLGKKRAARIEAM
jgi:hypothetical protein